MGWFKRDKPKAEPPRTLPTVKAPPGYPGLRPPAPPKKRGADPEQYERDLAAYRLAMRAHFASIAKFNRERSAGIGITEYEWMAGDDQCSVARKNGGKRFRFDKAPAEGHVCEGQCDAADWCRCWGKVIVPGF